MRNARSLEQFAEVVAFRSTPLQFLRTAVEDDAAAIAVNLLTCSLREEGKGRHFVGERSKDWNEKHSRSSDQMQLDLACKEKKEAIHGEHKVGCRKKDGTTSMEWNCSEPFLTSCGIQKQELLEDAGVEADDFYRDSNNLRWGVVWVLAPVIVAASLIRCLSTPRIPDIRDTLPYSDQASLYFHIEVTPSTSARSRKPA